MSIFRSPHNPIIEPGAIRPYTKGFEVIGVFNAAVTRLANEVILLLRVAERPISEHPNLELTAVYEVDKGEVVVKEFSKDDPAIDFSDSRLICTGEGNFLTSLSHLRVARSKDGVKFEIEDLPAIFPENDYETFGVEDPRITIIDGTYYITYVGVSPGGIVTCLASTKDFRSFRRHGVIFCPDNKNVAIFPERINGKFYALHRPNSSLFEKQQMWIAESDDLIGWGNHRCLMASRRGFWDSLKIGTGAVPFKIDAGWLEIYHGVDETNRYCLGVLLLDKDQPWKIISRSEKAVLEPEADYEIEGFFGNVIFSCGLLCEEEKLKIYYGVADTSMAYAELPLGQVVESLNLL